jgi:hypothetical protein
MIPSTALNELAAWDVVSFAARILGFNPDGVQRTVLRSQSKRLALLCTRQWGKSTIAGIRALHKAVYEPNTLTLLISNTLDQAMELFKRIADLSSNVPNLVSVEQSKTHMLLENGARIKCVPASEQSVRGYTAHLCIIDEAALIEDIVFSAVTPTIATTDGALLLLSSAKFRRWFFFDIMTAKESRWERYTVKHDQCARISREFIEEERRRMSPMHFAMEYDCEFMSMSGGLFTAEMLEDIYTNKADPAFRSFFTGDVKPYGKL